MKILLEETEEFKNPFSISAVQTRDRNGKPINAYDAFLYGNQAVLDAMPDVDLDTLAEEWRAKVRHDYNFMSFIEYLKEQLAMAAPI